ncbi:serine dehydratase-like [Rhinatrema bivittatum]|uniref:serine dehydratase-like n=1 Tax=Rhinatrema bivittatum TaxID=194408 RepID=UPI00112A5BAA|nr:serine dehydratase-like [Rhinatrema bivittatum]XP_029427395.1 serine dehydratase-like [Rhinatrema bivittatum]
MEPKFYVLSPLLESEAMSKAAGTRVLLKLDNIQPTGSFKIRGIGHFCQMFAKGGCKHFVCSSGGNAGLAAAYASKKLGVPSTIVVPSSTPRFIVEKLKELEADVEVFGKVWDDANAKALELAKNEGWIYIPPFDHPLVWEGHSSLVRELKDSLHVKPGVIVLAVGGGGLLAGVVAGMREVGWSDVPIIAVETKGAESLNAAIKAGKLVTLPDITSIATCLGAKTVSEQALKCARESWLISLVVDDREALRAIEHFLDDERMLVEPSCAAALAAVYSGHIQRLQEEGRLSRDLDSIVMIVCGGSSINMAQLKAFKNELEME